MVGRREMQYGVAPLERCFERCLITKIAQHHGRRLIGRGRKIERHAVVPCGGERRHEVLTNEAGATGDENLHRLPLL